MENRSFETESGGTHQDPKDNPPGPQPRAGSPSKGRDQEESAPPLARITDDEDESPPAHVQRYLQQDQKKHDLIDLDLDYPAPEPVQEDRGSRDDPAFQKQASDRQKRRSRQLAVEGPCSLRPDLPNQPLAPPEPYPEPQQQPDDVLDPQQQPTDASDEQERILTSSSESWEERCSAFCRWMYTFAFQLSLHTFMVTLPLSTLFMGGMNLIDCHINQYLPPVMIAVGILGTPTVLVRIWLMVREARSGTLSGSRTFWLAILASESIIWCFSAVELYYFFEQTPSFTPGDEHYCRPRFYWVNTLVMYLTAAWMTVWLIVHFVKIFSWFSRRYNNIINYFN